MEPHRRNGTEQIDGTYTFAYGQTVQSGIREQYLDTDGSTQYRDKHFDEGPHYRYKDHFFAG